MKFQMLIKAKMLKNIDFSCFQTEMLINVNMPTIVDVLIFMSMIKFMLSRAEYGKFYNRGARTLCPYFCL